MPTISALHLMTGAGLVQRRGQTVVVVDDAAGPDGFADAVLQDCRLLSGRELVRRLARHVLGAESSAPIRLGVVTTAGGTPLAFLYGDVELRTDADVVSGADFATGIEVALGEVSSLVLAPGGSDDRGDPRTDLAEGVVAASGFALDLLPVDSPEVGGEIRLIELHGSPVTRPLPIDAEARDEAGESVTAEEVDESEEAAAPETDEHADDPEGAAAPETDGDANGSGRVALVEGVRCPREHHNDPRAAYCAQCGLKLGPHRTLRPVPGPRPQLGVLILDDGTTIAVDEDLVLGREPEDRPAASRPGGRAVAVRDPSQTVSRLHAHIVLEDWDVHVSDLGSANGTFVRLPSSDGWVEVAGGDRIRVTSGTTIRLGDRELVFQSHDVATEAAS